MRRFFQNDRALNIAISDKQRRKKMSTYLGSTDFGMAPTAAAYDTILNQAGYTDLTDSSNTYSSGAPFLLRIEEYEYIDQLSLMSSYQHAERAARKSPADDFLDRNGVNIPCVPRDCLTPVKLDKFVGVAAALKQWYAYRFPAGVVTLSQGEIRMFRSMDIFGDHFGSKGSRSNRSSYVRAFRMFVDDTVNHPTVHRYELHAACIQYFFKHAVTTTTDKGNVDTTFAVVQWYTPVKISDKYSEEDLPNSTTDEKKAARFYHKAYDLSTKPIYIKSKIRGLKAELCYQSLIPISHIVQRVMIAQHPVSDAGEFVVVPLERKLQG